MEKVGILGGTFNPVHTGHLILAQSVMEQFSLDKVIFVPCHIPALKTPDKLVEANQRLEMLKLAIEDNPGFLFSDIEIKREGVSYTVDTLRSLKNDNIELFFIIGEDNLKDFNKWKEPDEILKLAKLIVTNRGGYDNQLEPKLPRNGILSCRIPNIEISSSDLRKKIEAGLSVQYLVPDKVYEYIKVNNLYK